MAVGVAVSGEAQSTSWVRFQSPLIRRIEDWRNSLGRSLRSLLLEYHVAKELQCLLESRSCAWNSLASLRHITQLAVERSMGRA